MLLSKVRRKWRWFLINRVYCGTKHFEKKRKLLIKLGYAVGEGTQIVGPLFCTGTLTIGKNCWIGRNLTVHGNGTVVIEDCCDIAPDVTFATGGHEIGSAERRAGKGQRFTQAVGKGTWIGTRVTVLNETQIGASCVIAACACVTKSVAPNSLVGGVPAKLIRSLDHAETTVQA